MEKWEKTIDDEGLKQELMKDIKGKLPTMEDDIQKTLVDSFVPVLIASKDAGEKMEETTWVWFFQWAENFIGRDKFRKYAKAYLKATEGPETAREMKS